MNILEFQEASKRTAPFNANATNEQELNWFLSNYTLGLVGETLELSQVLDKHKIVNSENKEELFSEFIKECGDVWHYAVNLLSVLGEEYDDYKSYQSSKPMRYEVGEFVECIKKSIYHGHGIDKEKLINILYAIIGDLKDYSGIYLDTILVSNINKLKKRYPEKFTTEDSIARVDTK